MEQTLIVLIYPPCEIPLPIYRKPILFADTIRNNLTNGNEEISDEQIEAVCKMCLANQFIETLPLGYDTVLSENGENLSNGQRQKSLWHARFSQIHKYSF